METGAGSRVLGHHGLLHLGRRSPHALAQRSRSQPVLASAASIPRRMNSRLRSQVLVDPPVDMVLGVHRRPRRAASRVLGLLWPLMTR